jgi:hypothetical protein
MLQQSCGGSLNDHLARLAQSASRDYDYLETIAIRKLKAIQIGDSRANRFIFSLSGWKKLDSSLQYLTIQLVLRHLNGGVFPQVKIEELDKIVRNLNAVELKKCPLLPQGIKILVKGDQVVVSRDDTS